MIRKALTKQEQKALEKANPKKEKPVIKPEKHWKDKKVKQLDSDFYKVYTIICIKGETHSKLMVYRFEDREVLILSRIFPNKKYDIVLEKEIKDLGKKFIKKVIERKGNVELPRVKKAKKEARKNETDEDILQRATLRKKKKKMLLKDATEKIDSTFDSVNTNISIKDGFIDIYLKNTILNGKPLASGSHKISIDVDTETYYYYYNGKLRETASTLLKILK